MHQVIKQGIFTLLLLCSFLLESCGISFNSEDNRLLEDENIPNEYFCPITQEIMEDPVIAKDGHTYERSAIQTWFNRGGTIISPKTGAVLLSIELIPNHTMRSLIQDFKENIPNLSKHKLEMRNMEIAIKSREEEINNKQEKISQLEQQLAEVVNSNQLTNAAKANPGEVILFCGNPGVGKSSLCNSVFGQAVFKSGVSLGTGLTIHKQEHIYESKLYIDTPGLDDADAKIRKQAAVEIEKALKHNNNYKIVFVATLEEGRIRPADLVTINAVCDAIKDKFEYGIIFNKVIKKIITKIEEAGVNQEILNQYLIILHKQPSSVIILKKDNDMEGEDDVHFQGSDENRQKLVKFLENLKASRIEENNVKKIDISYFQAKIEEMEKSLKKTIVELEKTVAEQRKEIIDLKHEGCLLL